MYAVNMSVYLVLFCLAICSMPYMALLTKHLHQPMGAANNVQLRRFFWCVLFQCFAVGVMCREVSG